MRGRANRDKPGDAAKRSEEQKAKWLPRIASGELRLQAFGVAEPTSGTDTSSLKTFAKAWARIWRTSDRTMMNHSTAEVFFTDMRVPAENLIGGPMPARR